MQHYQPYESDSDGVSDSSSLISGSESTGTSEAEHEDHDARMSAMDQWRQQGQAWLAGGRRHVVQDGPGAPNHLGLWNTQFEYAEERRVSVLMLDSLDRDQAVYPLPTSVRFKLPRVYRNVERIDICQIKFLNAIWAISATRGNNRLTWIADGNTYSVDLSDGTYTGQQLVNALADRLIGTDVSVTYNCTAGRFVIAYSGPGAFELPWASTASSGGPTDWGLGWNLGFGGLPADMTGASSYMASHMPRLFDDYVFLRLNDMEMMNDVDHTDLENVAIAQDSTGQVGHYFGKLLLNNFGCWAQTFIEAPKRFRPVLGRLERLNVDWVNRHGVPLAGVDAGTCDWHMTVRITEIVEGPSATSAMTRAGGPRPT